MTAEVYAVQVVERPGLVKAVTVELKTPGDPETQAFTFVGRVASTFHVDSSGYMYVTLKVEPSPRTLLPGPGGRP